MANCIFIPASGYRSVVSNGALGNQGSFGYYWSSTQLSSTQGYGLDFTSTNNVFASPNFKEYGLSVRCVR